MAVKTASYLQARQSEARRVTCGQGQRSAIITCRGARGTTGISEKKHMCCFASGTVLVPIPVLVLVLEIVTVQLHSYFPGTGTTSTVAIQYQRSTDAVVGCVQNLSEGHRKNQYQEVGTSLGKATFLGTIIWFNSRSPNFKRSKNMFCNNFVRFSFSITNQSVPGAVFMRE